MTAERPVSFLGLLRGPPMSAGPVSSLRTCGQRDNAQ
jgi:hypothetical protein